jgi:hypothetical protein
MAVALLRFVCPIWTHSRIATQGTHVATVDTHPCFPLAGIRAYRSAASAAATSPSRHRRHPVIDQMKTAGLFNPAWDVIYQLDPEWLEQFLAMAADLYRSVLPPKLVELMAIAVDASCTHLYTPGIRRTVQGALAQGPPSKRSWKFSSYAGHLGSTRASSAPRSCPREWRRLIKDFISRRRHLRPLLPSARHTAVRQQRTPLRAPR